MGNIKITNTHINLRIDEEIKIKAEKATALLGHNSLTEYLVRLIDKDASRVISEYESITLEVDVFDLFWAACNRAKKPNKALLEAADYHNLGLEESRH